MFRNTISYFRYKSLDNFVLLKWFEVNKIALDLLQGISITSNIRSEIDRIRYEINRRHICI